MARRKIYYRIESKRKDAVREGRFEKIYYRIERLLEYLVKLYGETVKIYYRIESGWLEENSGSYSKIYYRIER